eukprot:bmy_10202T0
MSALTRPKAGDRTSPWEATLAAPLQVPAVNVSAADPWLPCLSVGQKTREGWEEPLPTLWPW